MYPDGTQTMGPPLEGWLNITPETMWSLVINLLRHLSHVKNSGDDGPHLTPFARCAVWTDIANWLIKRSDQYIVLTCSDDWDPDNSDENCGPILPYCIGLKFASRGGTILLLNAK
ncbi:uncharacterized protein M421DRAFT_402800 [Didymella exigua CBS 183.55]|uniref:Uncharacterized protein n=1 Tax=Didymella exigua CBS 183.55 TaxID=1150837 RepID=A0A6A5RU90_9PLEO|nr:uncharacterized protein M421DRAFT_402800 [Didymella exigua CBS 183.55]KAF1932035.1 hypothetical protein M421DRAFT_402800 [Didymella exigua CBS 183.55]